MEVIYNNCDGGKHVYIGTELINKLTPDVCEYAHKYFCTQN